MCSVLLVDQPQFGLSDKPETKEQFNVVAARAVRDLLDELDIPRAHFLGNSLGGGTTFRFALDYPDRADRLVLMGPGGACIPVLSPEPTEGVKILGNFLAPPGPSREKLEAFVRIMVYDPSLVTEELIEERYKVASDPSVVRGLANFLMTVMGPGEEQRTKGELWREIHEVKHRTLITWGRDDRVLPLDGALFMLHRMEDARLHVFSRCGHWAQLEHAREFERISIDFLTADTCPTAPFATKLPEPSRRPRPPGSRSRPLLLAGPSSTRPTRTRSSGRTSSAACATAPRSGGTRWGCLPGPCRR
jgi:4,5:9,10-diseco-3-hydroxy-5,9,17-trioxoandrosta-1(10),2-diene-4-oate hydrolase